MRISLSVCLSALVAAIIFTAPAAAQNAKSFVASTGDNANDCASEATPCRTLNGAHGKTNGGGIITCLDNGEFGGLTINKSIIIDCAGTGASVVSAPSAILIQANPTDIIHIRGLKIFSGTTPLAIIGTASAKSVRVEECDIIGGSFVPALVLHGGVPSSNLLELLVVNTTISNAAIGVQLVLNGGAANVTLDNVRIFNSAQNGIDAIGTNATTAPGLRLMVKNSTITGSSFRGIRAQSTNGTTRVFVKDSVITQNDVGLQADGTGAAIFASGTTVTQNNHGLSAIDGGRLFTYGNNETQGNVQTNGVFTAPVALQ